jgi:hypothetical protein
VPHIDVGYGGEGDETENDDGYEGQEHQDEHLIFAERETHVQYSFLARFARLLCTMPSVHIATGREDDR